MKDDLHGVKDGVNMNSYTFSVSLRFSGPDFDPRTVADYLELEPKWVHEKGLPRVSPSGKILGGTYEESYCSFPLCKKRDGNLYEFLLSELEKIKHHSEKIIKHTSLGNSVEFFIGWYGSGNIGETFKSDLMSRLGELNIDLSLDIYQT
ncbi:DUF4279 domain-containing protein [Pseudomonas gingeri]